MIGYDNFYTCHLMGGLGNQMFQIAKTINEGLVNNVPTFFRKNSYTPLQGNSVNHYIDNIFSNINFDDKIKPEVRISETDWSYNNLIYPKNKNIEFYGFFQSSKNFKQNEEIIKELFKPTKNYIDIIYEKFPQLNQKKTLSIHIRRGDYLKFPHVHPTIGVSYIKKALEIVGEYSTIFIFTDDIEWVNNNLKLDKSVVVNEEDYIELWIMSLCENNILSNSSFSWWGSYLNNNKNKIVISPSIWFNESGPKNFSDIFEENWTLIEVISNNGILEIKN